MKIFGIGYDNTNENCYEKYFLNRMKELIPSLSIANEIPEEADVLVINLTRKTGKALFGHQIPEEKTYKIVVVHELFRSTLPYLKLADFVIFTNDYQRRVCEELLNLTYNSTVLPLPSGDFDYRRPEKGDCIVYFDLPYTAETKEFIEKRIKAPYEDDVVPNINSFHFFVPCLSENDFAQLEAFVKDINPAYNLFDGNLTSKEELQKVMQQSTHCLYFKNEMNFDDFEGHMERRNSGMVHELIVDSHILADMKYCGLEIGRINDITCLNFDQAPSVTYKHWAELIHNKIEEEYNDSLKLKQGYLDNLEYDTLDDVNIVLGQPLSNRYIFSICFRNQEAKIQRCIYSILKQNRALDFGIVLVDDCSVDASIEKIVEVLDGAGVDCCVVSNKKRNFAARNFYNVVNLYTTNDESVIVEVDGDDFLHGTEVLDTLEKYYANGALKTNGSYKMFPDGQEFMNEADVIRNHECMDYTQPWNLDKCNAWLHLRTSKRHLIRSVEINHFLDRNSHNWLPDRHDAALQPRIIELAEGKVAFVKEVLYNYDISGDNHDHDNSEWEEEYLKLFGHIDKIYHPIVLSE